MRIARERRCTTRIARERRMDRLKCFSKRRYDFTFHLNRSRKACNTEVKARASCVPDRHYHGATQRIATKQRYGAWTWRKQLLGKRRPKMIDNNDKCDKMIKQLTSLTYLTCTAAGGVRSRMMFRVTSHRSAPSHTGPSHSTVLHTVFPTWQACGTTCLWQCG